MTPLFKVSTDRLVPLPVTTLVGEGWRERGDLQRLLRDCPEALEDGLFIVAEEFSNWADSSRRIDLLGIDQAGRLVVIELKRDEDGGFMDLQAIRYASMVANMTFEQVVDAHAAYLRHRSMTEGARERVIEHMATTSALDPNEIDSVRPRMILVSGNFSRELTTSVLWLNDSGLDIQCVRVMPYKIDDVLVVDATRVIPLPGAEDYIIRVREKAAELEKRQFATIEWTRNDIEHLRSVLYNPTLVALFELCAARPGEYVSLGAAAERSGQSQAQARGATGGLTTLVRGRFGRGNWPIGAEWAVGGEAQMYYWMSPQIAEWWNGAPAPSTNALTASSASPGRPGDIVE